MKKLQSLLLLHILLFAGSVFGQNHLTAIEKDSLFNDGINKILIEMPSHFKKFCGKEFFENNGVYYQ